MSQKFGNPGEKPGRPGGPKSGSGGNPPKEDAPPWNQSAQRPANPGQRPTNPAQRATNPAQRPANPATRPGNPAQRPPNPVSQRPPNPTLRPPYTQSPDGSDPAYQNGPPTNGGQPGYGGQQVNPQQPGYPQQQQGYPQQQQGYPQQQQGYPQQQQGYPQQQQGYPQQQKGYPQQNAQQEGYEQRQSGYQQQAQYAEQQLAENDPHSEKMDPGKRIIALMFDFVACYMVGVIVVMIPFVKDFASLQAVMLICLLTRDYFFGGRGVGKNFMGFRVVDAATGGPPSIMQSFLRNIILLAPFAVFSVVSPLLRFVPNQIWTLQLGWFNEAVISFIHIIGTVYYAIVLPLEIYRAYSRADGLRIGDEIAKTAIIESPMDFSNPIPRQS